MTADKIMNSEVFVNASSSFAPSEVVTIETPIPEYVETGTQPRSVAAVIRPVRHLGKQDRTVLIDSSQAATVPQPHTRSHQLEDYVTWLKQQAASQKNREKASESNPGQAATSNHGEASKQVTSAPRPTTSTQQSSNRSSADQATSNDPEFTVRTFQRVDSGHESPGAPSLAAYEFKTTADLQRIEAKLAERPTEMPRSSTNDALETPSDAAADSLAEIRDATPIIDVKSNAFNRADIAHTNLTNHPRENADDLIATISKAIATVLTDQSEDQVEQKIRLQLEGTSHHEALAALPAKVISKIIQEVADSNNIPYATDKTEVATVAELVSSPDIEATADVATDDRASDVNEASPLEQATSVVESSDQLTNEEQDTARTVPADVAAWDVEDFRWPAVTNHMIATGSQAISHLADSTAALLSGSSRLTVASSGRGEGSTSLAISLARWTASSGKKVLLVDGDLASPGLSSQVGLASDITWITAANGSVDPAEVIVRSQANQICIMPLNQIETRVTYPRFIYDLLGDLVSQVQSEFDLVIVDIGPTSQLFSELSKPELLSDATLLVHNNSGSPQSFLQTTDQLQKFGISKYVVAQNTVRKVSANVA